MKKWTSGRNSDRIRKRDQTLWEILEEKMNQAKTTKNKRWATKKKFSKRKHVMWSTNHRTRYLQTTKRLSLQRTRILPMWKMFWKSSQIDPLCRKRCHLTWTILKLMPHMSARTKNTMKLIWLGMQPKSWNHLLLPLSQDHSSQKKRWRLLLI